MTEEKILEAAVGKIVDAKRDDLTDQEIMNGVPPRISPAQPVSHQAKSLVGKLAEAFANVGGQEKLGENRAQGYKYLKAADVAKAIRHELFKRGILLVADEQDVQWSEFKTNNGSRMTVCRLKVLFTFTDGIDSIQLTGWGESFDSGDKAIYKAKTGALKYAMRGLSLMPDEKDDPEGDEKVDRAMAEDAAAANEEKHLAKFQEREKVQPPPVEPKKVEKQAEGVVVLTKISEAKTKKGDIYWKMDVTDVNGQSSLVSVFDKKLMIPELWNAGGKDLRIKVGSKTSGDKIYYNLLSIQQIGAKEIAGEEEIPMFDGE